MIHAYSELYLECATNTMGYLFDIAFAEMKDETFLEIFSYSDVAKAFENGNPTYLAGKSSYDLYYEIIGKDIKKHKPHYNRNKNYWCGYIYSYIQWYFNCTYERLFEVLPLKNLKALYPTLHEADISKLLDIVYKMFYPEKALKTMRLKRHLSQSELAKISGVKLRSIKAYEQGDLDISKASYETLWAFANILCCEVKDIIS